MKIHMAKSVGWEIEKVTGHKELLDQYLASAELKKNLEVWVTKWT